MKLDSSQNHKRNYVDNDFASILYESKFDKIKPFIKVLCVVAIIVGASYGIFVFTRGNGQEKESSTSQTTSTKSGDKTPVASDGVNIQAATEQAPANNAGSQSQQTKSTATQGNNTVPVQTSTYDPHKCDAQLATYNALKSESDQKKITYDNALAASHDYGYFYDKYGNKIDADREYKKQKAQIDQLMTDWKDGLTASNAAYSKYQSCQGSNLSQ